MAQLTFANPSSHLNVNLSYERELSSIKLSPNDSLLVVGKTKDLKNIKSSDIAALLKDLSVQESWFDESIDYLCKKSGSGDKDSKPTSGVSWLNKLVIETISSKCSRSNTPTGGHKLAKIVHRNTYGSQKQAIVVVCEHAHAVASAAAVARSFPLFSAKTSKNDPTKPRVVQVFFIFPGQSGQPHSYASQEEVECFSILARSIRLTARITDTPCADMTTTHFLDEIKLVANELGLVPTVIEGEELNKRGFGGLYNVGKAAINSPKLVVLSNIKEASKKTFAWVGKGIVYDTGGLCIKSRTGMCSMKRDCGGAAGILGAFYAAVKMGFSDNLHAVFCLAENAVGPISYRPDDIIKLYSGKTVEVTNTDAEGRLVLGDGVAYARKDLKADVIVDMATLTGGQGPATGRLHAAVVTNSDQWERACVDVGRKCGDLVHPLIYAPELLIHEFRSEVADMTNSVKNRDNATSSCAGHFIHAHLGSNFKGVWVHLDIASPVEESDRATGYGVTLLTSLFSKSIQNSAYKLITPESELPITAECEEDDE